MTERALREFKILAKYAQDPKERIAAGVFAKELEMYHASGRISRTLEDAGVPSSVMEIGGNRAERSQRPGHSILEFKPSLGMVINKISEASKMVTPKEGILLEELMVHMGEVVRTENLKIAAGWENYSKPKSQSLKVHMSSLRDHLRNIGAYSEEFPKGFILTIRGVGYVLIDPANLQHPRTFNRYV